METRTTLVTALSTGVVFTHTLQLLLTNINGQVNSDDAGELLHLCNRHMKVL